MRESPSRRRRRASRRHRPARAALTLTLCLLTLPAGGCCSLCGWLCGPDRSRWVVRDYRTPQDAVATFLEAIRRERPDVIQESLSEGAKRRYGLPGIPEASLAWERLKREIPGLHLAGEATPSAPASQPDGRVRYDLTIGGRQLSIWFVEQPYWQVRYRLPDEPGLDRHGRYVDKATFGRLVVVGGDAETTVDARIRDPGLPQLEPGQLREVCFGHDWKVDEFRTDEAQ